MVSYYWVLNRNFLVTCFFHSDYCFESITLLGNIITGENMAEFLRICLIFLENVKQISDWLGKVFEIFAQFSKNCNFIPVVIFPSIATKLWKNLWGVKIWTSMRGIFGWLWGYSSATFCEYLLKHAILLWNKMFKLQFILYGMFILYNVYYKCSPQAIFFKWWLFLKFS